MTKSSKEYTNIPRTGRIGRFSKIVEKETTLESFLEVMKESSEYNQYKSEQKAVWWKQAVERLENEIGFEKAVQVMRQCGSKCCGQGNRKIARQLMSESSSIQEFLEKLSKYKVTEGTLTYELVSEDTIVAKHNKCFCGQVKKTKEMFVNQTYCQCSVEFNQQFFSAAFEVPVEVKLNQSIISGGDFCEFIIKIPKSAHNNER